MTAFEETIIIPNDAGTDCDLMIEPWCDVIRIPARGDVTLKVENFGSPPRYSVETTSTGKVLDGDYSHVRLLRDGQFIEIPIYEDCERVKWYAPQELLIKLVAVVVGLFVGYLVFS